MYLYVCVLCMFIMCIYKYIQFLNMCVSLYILYILTIHRTHMYSANSSLFFGCDQSFYSTTIICLFYFWIVLNLFLLHPILHVWSAASVRTWIYISFSPRPINFTSGVKGLFTFAKNITLYIKNKQAQPRWEKVMQLVTFLKEYHNIVMHYF